MNGSNTIVLGVAVLALGGASIVFGATMTGAIRMTEVAPASGGLTSSSSRSDGGEPGATGPYPRVTDIELLEAVNNDLFQPDRLPALERYQFLSTSVPTPQQGEEPRGRRGPELRVVGSAVMGEAAVALVQVEDSVPVAVLLGERIEGYVLAQVGAESATLVGLDETLTLPVVEPLPVGRASAGPAQLQINSRDLEGFQSRMQEVLRAQMMNERAQMMNRSVPLRESNPSRRGGRGGGGRT